MFSRLLFLLFYSTFLRLRRLPSLLLLTSWVVFTYPTAKSYICPLHFGCNRQAPRAKCILSVHIMQSWTLLAVVQTATWWHAEFQHELLRSRKLGAGKPVDSLLSHAGCNGHISGMLCPWFAGGVQLPSEVGVLVVPCSIDVTGIPFCMRAKQNKTKKQPEKSSASSTIIVQLQNKCCVYYHPQFCLTAYKDEGSTTVCALPTRASKAREPQKQIMKTWRSDLRPLVL